MKIGDYVLVGDAGDVQVIDRETFDRDRGTAKVLGIVRDMREPPDDSVIELEPDENNIAGPFITLGSLKEQSHDTFGGAQA